MAVKLIAVTAVLLLSLVAPSVAGAHSEPPPKHQCRAVKAVSRSTPGGCVVVSRLGARVAFVWT